LTSATAPEGMTVCEKPIRKSESTSVKIVKVKVYNIFQSFPPGR
jgi:hypothetical protein